MSIGRQDYTARKEERIDRLEARAASAQVQSDAAARRSAAITDGIPLGQPILVDHYSAKSHRRALENSRRNMDKAVELSKKADYLQGRADAARSNKAISGDDPAAVQKLRDKLEALQKAQDHDKAANAHYRKHGTMKGFPGVTDADAQRMDAELAEQDASPYSSGKHMPVPAWCLSNRNAEINRIKKRLAELQQVDQMGHVEIPFTGGTITTNEDINRVQILFDEKPDEATLRKLKGYGFRWSPREGAWQTQRAPQNLRRACWALDVDPDQIPSDSPQEQPAAPAGEWTPDDPREIDDGTGYPQLSMI